MIIAVYLIASMGVGIAFRGKQDNADDYFQAGGRFSSNFQLILVGFSIAATLFSGISFLSYPSVTYGTGIRMLLVLVTFPISWALLHYWFLPKFFQHNVTHPYDIIEVQFGRTVRLVASTIYIFFRIFWMGALIYAPTLMIITSAGLDDSLFWPIVLTIGIVSTVYTTIGGIRGVIITDAIQFMVIIIGIGAVVFYAITHTQGSLGDIFSYLKENGHLKLANFTLDPTENFSFLTLTIGILVVNLGIYVADQMSLQRYLATGSVKAASRSFAINVFGAAIVVTTLVFLGLVLAAWYGLNPDPLLPETNDKIFPYFIATQIPPGIAGLLIAAVLAATMSSMTSGINALAGCLTNDFYSRFGQRSEKSLLRFGRVTCIIVGLLSTISAGFLSKIGSIWDITQTIGGCFLGPLFAVIIFSIHKMRFSPQIIIAGVVMGFATGLIISFTEIASLWSPPGSFTVALLVPFAERLFFKKVP